MSQERNRTNIVQQILKIKESFLKYKIVMFLQARNINDEWKSSLKLYNDGVMWKYQD